MASTEKAYPHKARLHILDSVISGAVVLYATYLLQNVSDNRILLCILFLLLAVDSGVRLADGKRTRTPRLCLMAFYLAGAVLILILTPFHASLLAAAAVVLIVLLFNRVMAILKKPKKRVILLNVLCILMVLFFAFFFFTGDMLIARTVEMEEAELEADASYANIAGSLEQLESTSDAYFVEAIDLIVYMCLMMAVLLMMILHVVGISVSQMKLNILMNIIRETYVLEILLGLLMMIIACSTVFMTLEESMNNYGDALWYSFALVTTIGFGDITASTVIGRLLSVFLGMYGIVVVAIITSVIVNFYGEMRRMNGQKTDAKEELPDTEE